jgi:L-aminopeptidase/D-esterase-like protein
MLRRNTITEVPGIKVGHATNSDALTGSTVVLCEKGATAGVDQRGGAPGTRETDLLRPMHLVEAVQAVLIAGGSAFGLEAASGVVKFLEEKGMGYNAGVIRVPIVPAAILFDLGIGSSKIRPDALMGYQACKNATSRPPLDGNVGAGTGCTVGKIMGPERMMKSGIGSWSVDIGNGIYIGAIVAVNSFGDVIDPLKGTIIAGLRSENHAHLEIGTPGYFTSTVETMKSISDPKELNFSRQPNTVIGVVATNAKLTKIEANIVAQMSHDGLARSIQPAHTMFDGDTIFALSTGNKIADVNVVGAYAAEMVTKAILCGVKNAKSAGGVPGLKK